VKRECGKRRLVQKAFENEMHDLAAAVVGLRIMMRIRLVNRESQTSCKTGRWPHHRRYVLYPEILRK
jgi:hypothetical protein